MAVSSKHPLYSAMHENWVQLRDTYKGERAVKEAGRTYLPPTSGMEFDGMNPEQPGYKAYQAYKTRAVFHDFVKDAVEGFVGIIHREDARIEVPAKLEPLLKAATPAGENLQTLYRKVTEAQLLYGRVGLLVEAPDGQGPAEAIPFIAAYPALKLINWDDGPTERGRQRLQVVVLDESEDVRDAAYQWRFLEKYRVLAVGPDAQALNATVPGGAATPAYTVGLSTNSGGEGGAPLIDTVIVPSIAGRTLEEIPFVIVGTNDLATDPADPPLLGLSNLALAIYRGEADYRQALFMQGQGTLVIIGKGEVDPTAPKDTRVGAGATLELPAGGEAYYVEVSADGLKEMKAAIDGDKDAAMQRGGRLLSTPGGKEDQSGVALNVRVSAQTASLISVAKTGAEALARVLRFAAIWVGANPDEVKVEPNLDFVAMEMSGRELLELMQAKAMGAPLSLESIHRRMAQKDLTEKTFEEEMELVDQEEPLVTPEASPGEGDDPNDPGNENDPAERA